MAKVKRRPKELRWKDFGSHSVDCKKIHLHKRKDHVLFFRCKESDCITLATKSQCEKLIKWLTEVKEFLK